MVRGEDFFLKRWLAYYRQFLPDEHIYVLNHGGDPEVAEITRGVNVISLPYDETCLTSAPMGPNRVIC